MLVILVTYNLSGDKRLILIKMEIMKRGNNSQDEVKCLLKEVPLESQVLHQNAW